MKRLIVLVLFLLLSIGVFAENTSGSTVVRWEPKGSDFGIPTDFFSDWEINRYQHLVTCTVNYRADVHGDWVLYKGTKYSRAELGDAFDNIKLDTSSVRGQFLAFRSGDVESRRID